MNRSVSLYFLDEGERWDKFKGHMGRNWGKYALGAAAVAAGGEEELLISLDTTWVSKYIWRGQDFYDDHAAFQPSINFDLYGTGFSANFLASYAGSSGFRDSEEFDYSFAYSGSTFDGEKIQTLYAISWLYYDVYDAPSRDSDSQDLVLDLAWPELKQLTICL